MERDPCRGCILNCFMWSSLPCFFTFCCSSIPTSCCILNLLCYYIHISFSQMESLQLLFNFVNSLSLDHWWVRCLSPFPEASHVWPPLLPISSCRTLAAMQSACHRGRWVSPLWYPEWEPYRIPTPGLVWRSDPSSGSLDSHQYLSDHRYLDGIMRHRDYHKRESYLQPSPCCLHESIKTHCGTMPV